MIRIKNPNPSRLPNEYQEVEYIESTETQYIDTGYTPANGDEIEIKNVRCINTTKYQTIFSAGTGDYQWILSLAKSTESGYANYKYFAKGSASVVTSRSLSTATTVKSNSSGLYYNGTLVSSSVYGGTANTSLRLFKRANDTYPANAQMGEVTIRSGTTVVRNMIPCYRKSDNEPGMYDLVNNVFYTNAGTGTFLIGTEVGRRDMNIHPTIGDGKTLLERYMENMLVYQKSSFVDTEFTSCPFPTSWTEVTLKTKYAATNNYGIWDVLASGSVDAFLTPDHAFDNQTSTEWNSTSMTSTTATRYIEIDCPVLIKPKNIYLVVEKCGSGAVIQGYNPSTEDWEDLYSVGSVDSKRTKNVTVTTEIFYSKFRFKTNRYDNYSKQVQVYEFQITSGTIRQEG